MAKGLKTDHVPIYKSRAAKKTKQSTFSTSAWLSDTILELDAGDQSYLFTSAKFSKFYQYYFLTVLTYVSRVNNRILYFPLSSCLRLKPFLASI